MESLNLVLCSDNNFILPTLTAIDSILRHNAESFFAVFIVTTGFSQKNIETIDFFFKTEKKSGKNRNYHSKR